MLNSIFSLLGLLIPLCLVGCGQAPQPAGLTPADASVTQTFAWDDYNGICNALRSWVPTQTNIQFSINASNSVVYLFSNTKITQNGIVLTTFSNYVGIGGAHTCDYQIQNGRLAHVQ